MNRRSPVLPILLFLFSTVNLMAWGPRGHKIVAQIARAYMEKSAIDSVQRFLGDMSFEKASYWMDEVQMNISYDFMQPWHFVRIPKDKTYVFTVEPNVINVLQRIIGKLKSSSDRKKDDTFLSLKILFHLMADLHQPLHCGYTEDQGGTKTKTRFFYKASNLHEVWDTEILEYKGTTTEECLKLAANLNKDEIALMQKTDLLKWMEESRELLSHAYGFTGGKIDDAYVDKIYPLVRMQLIKAGIRLAGVLNSTFRK